MTNNTTKVPHGEIPPEPTISENRPQPTLISRKMSPGQMASLLVQRGIKDITNQLDFKCYSSEAFERGGFGSIYRGKLRDGRLVAIKQIDIQDWGDLELGGKRCKHAAHELYTWSKCDHPGVLKALGFALCEGIILLISPWMQNGSLTNYLKGSNPCDRLQLCIDLAGTVEGLHDKGIIHGDIKGDNILVSDNGSIQLVDFGSATLVTYLTLCFTSTSSHLQWTLRFTAPELLLDDECEKHTTKSDVYALGMAILQILTGELPYAEEPRDIRILKKIIRGVLPLRPRFDSVIRDKYVQDKLWSLLLCCWARAPKHRPIAAEVRQTLIEIKRESSIQGRVSGG